MSIRCKACDRKLIHLEDDLCTQCRRTAYSFGVADKQATTLVPRIEELDMFIPEEEKEAWLIMMEQNSSG